ncbi:hypothetical protein [Colwellia sp. MEBiC06753]
MSKPHKNAKFKFKLLKNDAIALAVVIGDTYPDDIIRLYTELTEFANQQDTRLLLVDFRQTSMDFETVTILELVKRVGKITQGFKVARMIPLQDFRQDIVEMCAEKHTIPIQNFIDVNEAKAWLLK